MAITVSFAAIVLTLFIGIKKRINVGVIGAVFALLIGCFVLDMTPSQIFGMLPVNIIFKILPITLFYGFALENNTLKLLVDKLLYKTARWITALPTIVYFVCILMGMSGIGAGSLASILGPLVIGTAMIANLNLLTCCTALALGAAVGSSFVTSEGGATALSIMEQSGYGNDALSFGLNAWVHMFVIFLAVLGLILITQKKNEDKSRAVSYVSRKPEPFDPVQKKMLVLIALVVIAIVLPLFLNLTFRTEFTAYLYKRLDIGLIMLCGALAAAVLKLGDINEVIKKRIPWNGIIVVCGMTMLIGVTVAAGLADKITGLVVNNVPKSLVLPVVALSAAFLSCFCSAVSIVMPTFFPLAGVIAASTGISLKLLICAIFVGAACTGASPFSTGGSLLLNCCTDEEKREKLMPQLLMVSGVNIVAVVLFYFFIQFL